MALSMVLLGIFTFFWDSLAINDSISFRAASSVSAPLVKEGMRAPNSFAKASIALPDAEPDVCSLPSYTSYLAS